MLAWKTLLQTIGQKEAKNYRLAERNLADKLKTAETLLQNDPSNHNLVTIVSAARDNLRLHQQKLVNGAKLRCRTHWIQNGDKGSKYFFNYLKQKHINENITSIYVDNKELVDPNDIKKAFANYYCTLFTSEDNRESSALRNTISSIIPKKLTQTDSDTLGQSITKQEIINAISSLKKDKTPSPDGIPAEFYQANIGWISLDLLDLYNEAFNKGSLGSIINRGIIKLIPKEGDKTNIKNWRPITLLNVSYKILAKVLARKLESILPKFVGSTQTGFIKGRYILENLITSWEAMNWAKSSNQNVAIFLLDFEKAYDRIEWNFIDIMLKAFGFPNIFCNYIKILLKDAMAQVEINGSLSDPFPLTRSIRQGCPLAPALFVIASEALSYILTDNTISPAVKGITLPNNEELNICQFADDTSLFVKMEDINFSYLTKKLDLFCKISGARLSQGKCICLGWNEQPPGWFLNYGFQWGGPNNIVKYLGIPFAVDPSIKDMWIWVKSKITKKINN